MNCEKMLTDEMLSSVEKPGRYIGKEVNMVKKDASTVTTRFAMCFPDVYEVGMSHLGIKILYHQMNERDDCYCERAFAPWTDMEGKMRENGIPLYALETYDALSDFDFIGFTLQYEMSYTNILNMLDLANVPLLSKDRKEDDPFVIFGGPCAYNPEPLADIADFIELGEGEEIMNEMLDAYHKWKDEGLSRLDFLKMVSKIPGIYVPSFYNIEYNDDGTIKKRIPLYGAPEIIKKRIIKDLDKGYNLDKMIVPLIEIVHDRIMLETFRGCTRGCRFCQAGMVYRPVREKSKEKLFELADKLIKSTGYDEVSLTSLSICDYSDIKGLVFGLIEKYKNDKVGVSLPSIRVDSFSVELINEIQKVRKTGLTFAPEAGSQRLRDIINKGVTEEDIVNSVTSAFNSGWSTIKLYFMIGLPYETKDDIKGIAEIAKKVVDIYMAIPKEKRKKKLCVTVSASCFVPKPFTPFQWVSQNEIQEFADKQLYLKKLIKNKAITYNYHDSDLSYLEAIFARGDRRLTKVLIRAWEKGCKFDAWQEYFDYGKWMEAFKEEGVDPVFYAYRERKYDEVLPWDFIDLGVCKKYLISENEKAKKAETTRDCRKGCNNCGMTEFLEGGKCFNGANFN